MNSDHSNGNTLLSGIYYKKGEKTFWVNGEAPALRVNRDHVAIRPPRPEMTTLIV